MAIPTWTSGEVLSAADINTWWVPLLTYRTSDLSRSSTTTLAIDPVLQVSVDASAVYQLDAQIVYSGTTTGDIAVGWSYPSGTLGTWAAHCNGTTVIGSSAGLAVQSNTSSTFGYMIRTEATDISASRTFGGTGASDTYAAHCWGIVRTDVTSGTFGVSWAQGGSDGTASVLRANSYMFLQRVG